MVTKIIDIYSKSVDINIQDSIGMTPLHLAVKGGYSEEIGKIINKLLKHPSINIDITDNDGKTAYDLAIDHNSWFASLEAEKQVATVPFGEDILNRLKPK